MLIETDDTEVQRRKREIICVLNLIEPDPSLGATYLSDGSLLYDLLDDETVVRFKGALCNYFGKEIDVDLHLTFWEFVDHIKRNVDGWPPNLEE